MSNNEAEFRDKSSEVLLTQWLSCAAEAYSKHPTLETAALALRVSYSLKPEHAKRVVNDLRDVIEEIAEPLKEGEDGEELVSRSVGALPAETKRRMTLEGC